MNPTVELVLKHKKANMRKSEFLMLEALKSAPHLNNILMAKNHMCVDFQYKLSGVTNTRQELTVWQIKSHFSLRLRESCYWLYTFFQTRLFSPVFHRLLIVIVVNARSLSSFTLFSDTFANSISRFNPISANFNSLPEIKVGTISARD